MTENLNSRLAAAAVMFGAGMLVTAPFAAAAEASAPET